MKIYGLIQGVAFRHGVEDLACTLGLTGWVRNKPDGSVKIVAEGEEEKLQKLMEWCRKGTELSRIDEVQVEWGEARGEFEGFEIK